MPMQRVWRIFMTCMQSLYMPTYGTMGHVVWNCAILNSLTTASAVLCCSKNSYQKVKSLWEIFTAQDWNVHATLQSKEELCAVNNRLKEKTDFEGYVSFFLEQLACMEIPVLCRAVNTYIMKLAMSEFLHF